MKRYMCVAAVLVLGSVWSFGAHFVYDSSSMWAQSESTATDLDDMNGSDTQVDWKGGSEDTDVFIETFAETWDGEDQTAYCVAHSEMYYTYVIEGWQEGLQVSANASAEAGTYDINATATTYAGTATVAPGYSTGLFFKIMPDDGEQFGDTVEVTMHWNGHASVSTAGTAKCNAGFLNNDSPGSPIVVAVNPSDKNVPEGPSRVWTYPIMEQFGDGFQDGSDYEAGFTARIGDVIGVFAGNHADVDVSGEGGFASAEASHDFTFTLEYIGRVYTAADADIDGSGRVDLGDLAILAQFWLEEVDSLSDGLTCAGAISMDGFGSVLGDNYGAISSPMSACAGLYGFDDSNAVWYKFTSPKDAVVRFNVYPVGVDPLDASIALYDACGGNELVCHEAWEPSVDSTLTSGQTVYIRIGGYDLDEGTFELELYEVLPM